jgi:hypothetical protein
MPRVEESEDSMPGLEERGVGSIKDMSFLVLSGCSRVSLL